MASKANASPTPADVLLTWDDPRYHAAWGKLQEVNGRLAEVERRLQAEYNRQNADRFAASSAVADESRAIVFGTGYERPSAPAEDLKALRHEQRVLTSAVEIARANVDDVESMVSREVVAKILPAYREILRRQHAAAAALVAVADEERAFARALEDRGVRFGVMQRVTWGGADADRLESHARQMAEFEELLG